MSDLISRQDAIDTIMGEFPEAHYPSWYAEILRSMPSAQPRKGKWVDFSMSIKGVPTECCSECGAWSYDMGKDFCPNCGADMRGEQE